MVAELPLLLPIVGDCRTYQPCLASIANHYCHYCWLLLKPLLCAIAVTITIIVLLLVAYYFHYCKPEATIATPIVGYYCKQSLLLVKAVIVHHLQFTEDTLDDTP